jgi:hypothetical protein
MDTWLPHVLIWVKAVQQYSTIKKESSCYATILVDNFFWVIYKLFTSNGPNATKVCPIRPWTMSHEENRGALFNSPYDLDQVPSLTLKRGAYDCEISIPIHTPFCNLISL